MSSLTIPWCSSEPCNVPCHETPGTKDKQHHLHLPSSGCLRAMRSPLNLLSPRPDKPRVLSCSSQDMAPSPANNRPVVGNNSIGLNSWAFAALQVLHGVIEPHHCKHQHPTQNTGQSDRQFLCLWPYSRPDSEYFPQTLEKKFTGVFLFGPVLCFTKDDAEMLQLALLRASPGLKSLSLSKSTWTLLWTLWCTLISFPENKRTSHCHPNYVFGIVLNKYVFHVCLSSCILIVATSFALTLKNMMLPTLFL